MKNNYFSFVKVIDKIKKDYSRVINDEFSENNWNQEGKDIKLDILTFNNLMKDLNKRVNYLKNENVDNDDINDILEKVEPEIENAKNNIEPLIEKINDKVSHYACDFELAARKESQSEPKEQEVVMDLMNNQDILQKRRQNLEDIHQISAQIKETTDKMTENLVEQGNMLKNAENNVINAEENAKKAHKEIEEANKLSKSNKKCIIFYIILICIVLTGIGLIVYGIVKGFH